MHFETDLFYTRPLKKDTSKKYKIHQLTLTTTFIKS